MRGRERTRDPRVSGALVGMVGASTFMLVNRDGLPGVWPTVALLVWLVALGGCVWAVLLRQRPFPPLARPARLAGPVYAASVVGMVVLILAGVRLLAANGRADLGAALVALAVGLHFVPFAHAFRAPVFGRLGWSMSAIGLLGLLLGWTWTATAAAAAAVLAGLVILVVVSLDSVR